MWDINFYKLKKRDIPDPVGYSLTPQSARGVRVNRIYRM